MHTPLPAASLHHENITRTNYRRYTSSTVPDLFPNIPSLAGYRSMPVAALETGAADSPCCVLRRFLGVPTCLVGLVGVVYCDSRRGRALFVTLQQLVQRSTPLATRLRMSVGLSRGETLRVETDARPTSLRFPGNISLPSPYRSDQKKGRDDRAAEEYSLDSHAIWTDGSRSVQGGVCVRVCDLLFCIPLLAAQRRGRCFS